MRIPVPWRESQLWNVFLSLFVMLACVCMGVFVPRPTSAADIAESFIFPMRAWWVVTEQGEKLWSGQYHMGVDIGGELGVGAPVYAVADGVVKEVRVRSSFGLVVLIEHQLSDGSRVVSLYGHLKPTDKPVKEGQNVKMGERIGSLGDQNENGGWAPHLHFGIHKSSYSSTWIYYGHVHSQATAAQWHDPERFIRDRLTRDRWNPTVSLLFSENPYADGRLRFTIDAQDIGSGVKTVRFDLSDNGKASFRTLATFDEENRYPYRINTALPEIDSGNSYVRVVVTDNTGRQAETIVRLTRNISMNTRIGAVALKNRSVRALSYLTYQSGGVERALSGFAQESRRGSDVAVGDVDGDGEKELITTQSGVNPYVSITNDDGVELRRFKAFGYKKQRDAQVATGDLNGDGVDEIIVGFGPGTQTWIRIFNGEGKLIKEMKPFPYSVRDAGVDVAAGDLDGDGRDEVIVSSRGDGKRKTQMMILSPDGERLRLMNAIDYRYKSGANVSTGDVNGDGVDELLIGTRRDNRRPGYGIVVERPLNKSQEKKTKYVPFGDGFGGEIDITAMDMENDGQDELLFSQASSGEAWVKTYRFDARQTVLSAERVFESSHQRGTRITGWR